jgi:hypothetical protein
MFEGGNTSTNVRSLRATCNNEIQYFWLCHVEWKRNENEKHTLSNPGSNNTITSEWTGFWVRWCQSKLMVPPSDRTNNSLLYEILGGKGKSMPNKLWSVPEKKKGQYFVESDGQLAINFVLNNVSKYKPQVKITLYSIIFQLLVLNEANEGLNLF